MQITEVTAHVSRKRTRNYQSTEFSAGMKATIEFNENADAVYGVLAARCRKLIREEFTALYGEENGDG